MSDLFQKLAALSNEQASEVRLAGSDILAKAQHRIDLSILNSSRASIGSKRDAAEWIITNENSTTEDSILAHETLQKINGECRCEILRALNVRRIREMRGLEDVTYQNAIARAEKMIHCLDCADKAGYDGDNMHDQLNGEDHKSERQIDEEMRRREGSGE